LLRNSYRLTPADLQIFGALAKIRASALVTAAAADVLQAVCEVMIVTATSSILATRSAQDQVSHIIQTTMRRTEPDCQEAVARLFGRLSSLRSPQADITTHATQLYLRKSRADCQTTHGSQVVPGCHTSMLGPLTWMRSVCHLSRGRVDRCHESFASAGFDCQSEFWWRC